MLSSVDCEILRWVNRTRKSWTMTVLRSDAGKLSLNLCRSAGAVVATLLVIFCALFTLATVDFAASNSPQRGLERLLGSGHAWTSREVVLENGVGSLAAPAPEVAEVAHSQVAEELSGDGDHVESDSATDSAFDLESAPSPGEEELRNWDETPAHESKSGDWDYGVCLLVKMERRQRAIPYSELYRLFNAASSLKRRTVLVETSTKNPRIFCNMARDALGPSARCENFNQFVASTSTKCEHLVVGATQRYAPQPTPSELHKYGFQWATLQIVDLDAADPARQPPLIPESQWRPTIVTGFSSNHLEVGLLLLRSLGKAAAQQREFNVSAVVWTMGHFSTWALRALSCVVGELKSVYKVDAEVRVFDFGAWPPWMRINQKKGYNGGRGEYAWKAVMIHTVLVERGFVYWADAGDRFTSAAGLTQTLRHLKRHGFASRHSSGKVRRWTHPKQLQYFDADSERIKQQPNCDGSSMGFTLHRYSELARPWYECSITRQCIAPAGSSRKNHRQDQSALTLLVILSGAECAGVDSHIMKQMDGRPDRFRLLGVDATRCYKDPLLFRWHRKLM